MFYNINILQWEVNIIFDGQLSYLTKDKAEMTLHPFLSFQSFLLEKDASLKHLFIYHLGQGMSDSIRSALLPV